MRAHIARLHPATSRFGTPAPQHDCEPTVTARATLRGADLERSRRRQIHSVSLTLKWPRTSRSRNSLASPIPPGLGNTCPITRKPAPAVVDFDEWLSNIHDVFMNAQLMRTLMDNEPVVE